MDYTSVSNIKKYIEKHFSEEISLNLLAKEFGYSKYHLSKTDPFATT